MIYAILGAGIIGLGLIAYLMIRERRTGKNEAKLEQANSDVEAAKRIAEGQAHAATDSDALLDSLSNGSRKL